MFLVIITVFKLLLHPFHVSVTEVKYKEEEKVIQISSRIFLDDIEVALRSFSKNEKLSITKKEHWHFVEEQLEKYLSVHFKMTNERGIMITKYIGAEIENDVLWAYLEVEKVRKLKNITIWNSVLTEIYGYQENIIHFRAFDQVKSARLTKGAEKEVFKWE